MKGDPEGGTISASWDDWRLEVLYWSNIMPAGSDQKSQGGFLPVLKTWRRPEADLCIMFVQMRVHKVTGEPIYMPALPVSPGIPDEEQVCVGFGYHSAAWKRTHQGGNVTIDVKHTFSSSKGKVEEVHFPIRDRILMPYPTFLTSARFEQGMSGGPVLGTKDDVMNVIGIISRGMGQTLDSSKFTEWAILAGMLLTIEVDYKSESGDRTNFLPELGSWANLYFDETLRDITITKQRHETTFDYGSGKVMKVKGTWDV